MASDASSGTLAQIGYEEAVRGIAGQRSQLDELRARTGTLISAANIATAFLGATAASGHHGLPPAFLGALFPFALTVGLCIYVLVPRRGWSFSLRAEAIRAFEGQAPADAQWKLVEFLESANRINERVLSGCGLR